jgi:hypothetical protein
MDWAPARIVSLRCGDLRSSRYYLRYSPVQAEVEVRAALMLEGQVSSLQAAMFFAVLVVLLLAMLLRRLLRKVSNEPMRADWETNLAMMTLFGAVSSCGNSLEA